MKNRKEVIKDIIRMLRMADWSALMFVYWYLKG